MSGSVLFLDLATRMGWCEGVPGEKPVSGTIRLAPEGSPPAAVFGGLVDWLATRLTAFRYRMIIYEAPFDPRHMKTNLNTARMLLGLPAIVEGIAYQTGHLRINEANVNDIRDYLLGYRPKKNEGKPAVMRMLDGMGIPYEDDNEADAIAGWLYTCGAVNNRLAHLTKPLFAGTGKKA